MSFIDTVAALRIYDLAHPLEVTTPVSPNHPPFRMALLRRHGDVVKEDGSSAANELVVLGGHTGTHIDALAHFSVNGKLHGGVDAHAASKGGRFSALGIDAVAPIVCRGVLLDVPAALGVPSLSAAYSVTATDLMHTCEAQRVDIRRGDAVLIRTGWPVGRFSNPDAFIGWDTGVPGVDTSAARWLASRKIRLTGADTIAYEYLAPGAGHTRLPVHALMLVDEGINIVEVLDLEELARDLVREFVFVAAPLKIVGATGSPLRPLALSAALPKS